MGGYLKRRAQLLQKIRGGADGLAAPLPMAEVDANLDKLIRVLLGAAHEGRSFFRKPGVVLMVSLRPYRWRRWMQI